MDGDVSRYAYNGVYISQRICFARVWLQQWKQNQYLTAKVHKQVYQYHKDRKSFSKIYRRHTELIDKYNVDVNTPLQQGMSESVFYCNLH